MCRTTVCDKTRFVDFQSFLQVISSVISPGQTVIASCSLIICYFTNLFLAANFAGKFHWLIPTITSPPLTPCPCKITLGHWLTPGVPREEYPEYFPFKTWIFNFLCSVFNSWYAPLLFSPNKLVLIKYYVVLIQMVQRNLLTPATFMSHTNNLFLIKNKREMRFVWASLFYKKWQ